jgi:hypothetical protein
MPIFNLYVHLLNRRPAAEADFQTIVLTATGYQRAARPEPEPRAPPRTGHRRAPVAARASEKASASLSWGVRWQEGDVYHRGPKDDGP